MKLTKSSTYVPAPGECEKCPYQNKCNGGESCFDYDGLLEEETNISRNTAALYWHKKATKSHSKKKE